LAKRLEDFPRIARKAVRVLAYEGTSQADPVQEQAGIYGYALAFSRLLRYVEKRVPGQETFDDGIRRVARRVPLKVLRELIANALIHQDFMERGSGPLIEVFSDRIEISN